MAKKDIEQGRCQAVVGEHQCEHPSGHTKEHRDREITWMTDSHLRFKTMKSAKVAEARKLGPGVSRSNIRRD
jgi:hypothetical protein